MTFKKYLYVGTLVAVISSPLSFSSVVVAGSKAGAFIGGMIASNVLGNMHARTEAEQQQAANSRQQSVPAAAPAAAPAQDSAEDRIKQLDKLAAGGYITPAEYKAKKKSIVDSM
jgi:hypothetical protein